MLTRLVCLANSFKEGGRCLAGIELDRNDYPVFKDGRRNWIRPVCKSAHGEIQTELVSHINLLDVLEIEFTEPQKNGYQSENSFFNENSIRVVGNLAKDKLARFCENRPTVFGNKGKAVSEEAIAALSHSLMFVQTNKFEIVLRKYDDQPEKKQVRLMFYYNDNQYDFPVTDPVFLSNYKTNEKCLENIKEVYLSLSLGILWQNWHYKLIAAVITKGN